MMFAYECGKEIGKGKKDCDTTYGFFVLFYAPLIAIALISIAMIAKDLTDLHNIKYQIEKTEIKTEN